MGQISVEKSASPGSDFSGNQHSGGTVTHIELSAFLNRGPSAPEMLGLLQLIGSLVG